MIIAIILELMVKKSYQTNGLNLKIYHYACQSDHVTTYPMDKLSKHGLIRGRIFKGLCLAHLMIQAESKIWGAKRA